MRVLNSPNVGIRMTGLNRQDFIYFCPHYSAQETSYGPITGLLPFLIKALAFHCPLVWNAEETRDADDNWIYKMGSASQLLTLQLYRSSTAPQGCAFDWLCVAPLNYTVAYPLESYQTLESILSQRGIDQQYALPSKFFDWCMQQKTEERTEYLSAALISDIRDILVNQENVSSIPSATSLHSQGLFFSPTVGSDDSTSPLLNCTGKLMIMTSDPTDLNSGRAFYVNKDGRDVSEDPAATNFWGDDLISSLLSSSAYVRADYYQGGGSILEWGITASYFGSPLYGVVNVQQSWGESADNSWGWSTTTGFGAEGLSSMIRGLVLFASSRDRAEAALRHAEFIALSTAQSSEAGRAVAVAISELRAELLGKLNPSITGVPILTAILSLYRKKTGKSNYDKLIDYLRRAKVLDMVEAEPGHKIYNLNPSILQQTDAALDGAGDPKKESSNG